MKKTYISPELLSVEMRPASALLQASMTLDNTQTLDSGDILVKENNGLDVNIWDDEW